MLDERLLRYAVPALYKRMVEIFAAYHIHSYDVQTTAVKKEDGYEVLVRFSRDFSQSETKYFSFEQGEQPDEEVTRFFQETAEKCKSFLIADYYKMMKL